MMKLLCMQIIIDSNCFFVFDLDDTLFKEIDFLKSAYSHISSKLSPKINDDIYKEMLTKYHNKENVFEWIVSNYQEYAVELNIKWLLKEYREHMPDIQLSRENTEFLKMLKVRNVPTGLITDGRSVTQRNKLKALGIENYFDEIIVSEEFGSEKPDKRNYLYFENKYKGMNFYFFGDNTSKDFIIPSQLGWTTICVKNTGDHIHQQSFDMSPAPDFIISGFDEIELL